MKYYTYIISTKIKPLLSISVVNDCKYSNIAFDWNLTALKLEAQDV